MKQPTTVQAKNAVNKKEISLYFKDSKTIEEGNTSQQAREHHFQENLGRPHTFIYDYILVQYLVLAMRERTSDEKRPPKFCQNSHSF